MIILKEELSRSENEIMLSEIVCFAHSKRDNC